MTLRTTKYGPFSLGASGEHNSQATAIVFELQPEKQLTIQAIIDDGADDVVPTGTPVGSWRLHCGGLDNASMLPRITLAETGDASLTAIAPNGNNLVNGAANFECTPGSRGALWYSRSSGTARCTIYVTVS